MIEFNVAYKMNELKFAKNTIIIINSDWKLSFESVENTLRYYKKTCKNVMFNIYPRENVLNYYFKNIILRKKYLL